jgi:hypothetical protein
VEIVPESLDVRDDFFPALSLQMAREQDKGDVADFSFSGGQSRDVLQLQRRIIPEEDLGRILDRSLPGVDEFLFVSNWQRCCGETDL